MARPYRFTVEKFFQEYPQLVIQWDSVRNKELLIEDVFLSQTEKYWWKCKKGHSWRATVPVRTSGHNCPVCSGHEVQEGINDLATRSPAVAAEWNNKRNGSLKPTMVTAYSNKRVYWICEKGHEWASVINTRTRGSKCPYCAGRKLLKGFNDLETTNPALAAEWDMEKNGDLGPHDVMAGTDRKVWWRCKMGHSWSANIALRNSGYGCPVCSNQKLLVGYNDLASRYPTLAAEWDDEKNRCFPNEILGGAIGAYWWKCPKGHSYRARIQSRIKGNRCPYCRGRKVLKGYNDLATTHPDLAAQWDQEKNTVTVYQVSAGVSKKYWWKCKKGHSWQATVNSRKNGYGCPYCAEFLVSEGETDLIAVYPKALDYWDEERNHGLDPHKVSAKSTLPVWFRCQKGHSWRAMVKTIRTGECPYCAGKQQRITRYIT